MTKLKNNGVDDLFNDVQKELNEDIRTKAKAKIKTLLLQKISAEKVLGNIDRQIDDLRLQIKQELK